MGLKIIERSFGSKAAINESVNFLIEGAGEKINVIFSSMPSSIEPSVDKKQQNGKWVVSFVPRTQGTYVLEFNGVSETVIVGQASPLVSTKKMNYGLGLKATNVVLETYVVFDKINSINKKVDSINSTLRILNLRTLI